MPHEQVPVGWGLCAAGGGVNWHGRLPKAIGSGLTVGFLTYLYDIGGGFLIIPAFVLLLGLCRGPWQSAPHC